MESQQFPYSMSQNDKLEAVILNLYSATSPLLSLSLRNALISHITHS